jgi:hypothetical protein
MVLAIVDKNFLKKGTLLRELPSNLDREGCHDIDGSSRFSTE